MLIKIKLELSDEFKIQLSALVKVFRETVQDSAKFVWVDSSEYGIYIGEKKCLVPFCPKFYKKIEKVYKPIKDLSFSISKIKQGVSLYRSDMLYFSLDSNTDKLRELAVMLKNNLNVHIFHPFVPRITIAYSQLNYGSSASSNIIALIKAFNNELFESDFNRSFNIKEMVILEKESQNVLRKFSA